MGFVALVSVLARNDEVVSFPSLRESEADEAIYNAESRL